MANEVQEELLSEKAADLKQISELEEKVERMHNEIIQLEKREIDRSDSNKVESSMSPCDILFKFTYIKYTRGSICLNEAEQWICSQHGHFRYL